MMDELLVVVRGKRERELRREGNEDERNPAELREGEETRRRVERSVVVPRVAVRCCLCVRIVSGGVGVSSGEGKERERRVMLNDPTDCNFNL